jgi:predicted NBD/HSP70 family sugar kinase
VRASGQISRSDVAKRLRISPATVTALVSELIDLRMLQEAPDATRTITRGRPPVALSVRPDAGYVVGIKLARNKHTALLVDAAGQPMAEASMSFPPRKRTVAEVLEETRQVLDKLLARAGMLRSDLACLGLGLPGIVNHGSGQMIWSPMLTDHAQPLRRMAEDMFGVPVSVDNDANLVTLAELWFGKGRAMADFAVVTIEQGVGMGLVINHRLYRGAGSLGMELGHIKVQMDGALCQCGQRGCLEAYVADYALVREASTALDMNAAATPSDVMLQQLFEQAKAGNEAARVIFRRAGRFLALGLANVVNLFDPKLIILSGERMQYDYLYADDMIAEMNRMALNRSSDAPQRVETHAWGDLMWAQGAAALALSDLADTMAEGAA